MQVKAQKRRKNLWRRSNFRLHDKQFPLPFQFIMFSAFLGLFLLSETSISLCSALLLSILNRGIEFTKCALKSTNALQTQAVLELPSRFHERFSCCSCWVCSPSDACCFVCVDLVASANCFSSIRFPFLSHQWNLGCLFQGSVTRISHFPSD